MSRIGPATRVLTLAGAGALTACVAIPATPYPQPLAAFPGPNKTSAVFAQDDVACRGLAAAPQTPVATGSVTNNAGAAAVTPAPVQPTPASVYFACMTSHGNVIAAAPSPVSAYYAQYAAISPYPYGVYSYGGYYPGLFADEFFLDREVGLYGGFGGFYGFRGGYGGYRGGFGRGGFRR